MLRVGLLLLSAILTAVVGGADEARACSCLPHRGIEHVFAEAENVVLVNVRKEVRRLRRIPGVPTRDGTHRVYRAKVRQSYKGCIRRGTILKLFTNKESGLCGVQLDSRQDYVLALGHGSGKGRTFAINSCGFIRTPESLTVDEMTFLDSRESCCRGKCKCVGSERVSCLVDPCASATCGQGSCETNSCGDCSAEFYTGDGQPVCTPCTHDFECGDDQACNAGQCLGTTACESDQECPSDSWCRPTQTIGSNACAPFAGEGESCGGFTPPWAAQICAPDLSCVLPPRPPNTPDLPDRPGVCTIVP